MKRMLINATQAEEVRVALVDGQLLYDLDIESKQRDRLKDNIYKGRVARVEPSLQAAFVEIGEGRQAFLPLKAVAPQYMKDAAQEADQEKRDINSVLEQGQQIIIQVEKEARGGKGAAVTSYVSVAGRYVVLMPNNPRAGGISRRIEGEEREVTRELLSQLDLPNGMGIIIRTGGVGRSVEELQWDLDHLLKLWESISAAAENFEAPTLLFRDSDLISRAIRDYLSRDIGEILIDDEDAFNEARDFVAQYNPGLVQKVKRHDQRVPLFTSFQIESQIESAYRHRVSLPSGGSVIIERTEALVAIDVNSGRSTSGADIEETALSTNLEAVAEVARQLRLRDIGGLVVLDLIDMAPMRNRRQVEQAMEEALEDDRARTQIQRISRFGLLEMTRERLGASLEETSTQICPRCNGQGRIRDVPSTALSILRLSEEEALKRESHAVRARVPLEVASFLLNEKRGDLAEIEQRTNTHLVIVPTPHFDTPHFEIERIRESEALKASDVLSYHLMEPPPPPTPGSTGAKRERQPVEPAVVAAQRSPSPPPKAEKRASPGFLSAIRTSLSSMFSTQEEEEKPTTPAPKSKSKRASGDGQRRGQRKGQAGRKASAKDDKPQAKSRGQQQRGKAKAKAPQKQDKSETTNQVQEKEARAKKPRQAKARQKPTEANDKPTHAETSAITEERFTPPAEGETKRKPKRSRAESKPQRTDAKEAEAPTHAPQQAPESKSASIEVAETEQTLQDTVEAVETTDTKPARRAPKKRPAVKVSETPSDFQVETTEMPAPDAPAPATPTSPKRPAREPVRPANDPRASAKAADKTPEFELEEA